MAKTEELIASLAAEACAVKPLPPLAERMRQWVRIAIPVSAMLLLIFGLRHDLGSVIATPPFVFSGAFGFLVMVTAGMAALWLSVPGNEKPVYIAAPIALLLGWIGLLVLTAMAQGADAAAIIQAPWHWACVTRVALLSLISSGALWMIVRRGFVLDRGRSVFLTFVAGGALAAAALPFVCPVDRAPHLLVSHLIPVVLLAGLAAAAEWAFVSRHSRRSAASPTVS